MNATIVVTITNPKTGRKELWIDGKLVSVSYPPTPKPGEVVTW